MQVQTHLLRSKYHQRKQLEHRNPALDGILLEDLVKASALLEERFMQQEYIISPAVETHLS